MIKGLTADLPDLGKGLSVPVSRLRHIPGIGVDKVGDAADAARDPRFLRLENLDTDLPPPAVAVEATHAAVEQDDANSYLPFQGHRALREAAAEHVSVITGHRYDPGTQCVSVAGGLNGVLNVLLATGLRSAPAPVPMARNDGYPSHDACQRMGLLPPPHLNRLNC